MSDAFNNYRICIHRGAAAVACVACGGRVGGPVAARGKRALRPGPRLWTTLSRISRRLDRVALRLVQLQAMDFWLDRVVLLALPANPASHAGQRQRVYVALLITQGPRGDGSPTERAFFWPKEGFSRVQDFCRARRKPATPAPSGTEQQSPTRTKTRGSHALITGALLCTTGQPRPPSSGRLRHQTLKSKMTFIHYRIQMKLEMNHR
jgi:hypothetical protein